MPRSAPRRRSAAKPKFAMREPDEGEFDESDATSDDDDDDDEQPSERDSRPPTPKRSSRPSGGALGTKGSLGGILDLPLETFTAVCEHLDLETLFHLSRLDKRFFKFLRGTSALSYLWEWARKESGLPEVAAPCFSTVQLANLLFSKYCQNCARTTPKADFMLRVRLCQACSKNLIHDDRDLTFVPDEHANIYLCPYGTREGSGRQRHHVEYLLADIKFTSVYLKRWVGAKPGHAVRIQKGDGFIEPGLYNRKGFVDRCGVVRQLRYQDGDAITDWQQQRVIAQDQVRQARRFQRRKAIEARLVERGWQAHHFDSDDWKTHSLVNTARDLNDTIWRKIRGKLELFLQAHEAERDAAYLPIVQDRRRFEAEQEHAGLVADRHLAKALGLYPLPTWPEFSELDVVKKLWHVATIDEAYEDEYPTIATEAGAIAVELSTMRKAFKSGLVDKLINILADLEQIPAAIQPLLTPAEPTGFSADEEDDIVGLACCAVRCMACQLVDVFPRILAHKCMTHYIDEDGAASWNPAHYAVDGNSFSVIFSLLVVAGLEPDAHHSEVDALGSTFTCLCTSDNTVAVPWQDMVSHTKIVRALQLELQHVVVAETRQEALERVFEIHEKGHRWAGMRGDDDA
ncbi:hypothetical protein JCM9279_005494 [Rhodotorula babjevae]